MVNGGIGGRNVQGLERFAGAVGHERVVAVKILGKGFAVHGWPMVVICSFGNGFPSMRVTISWKQGMQSILSRSRIGTYRCQTSSGSRNISSHNLPQRPHMLGNTMYGTSPLALSLASHSPCCFSVRPWL